MLDFAHESRSQEVFEKGPKIDWIYTKGQAIEQAFWVYEGSHVLFRDQDHLVLAEVETYGKPHLYPVAEVRAGTAAFYNEESGKVFFLDRDSGSLAAVEILPRRDLILFPFPDRKEEKKSSQIRELP